MIIVIAGHYGVGKTNLALNMALDYREAGWDVTVADVDVVNPYFRSSDYSALLTDAGVHVVAPNYAGTSLDTPSLPPSLPGVIEQAGMAALEGVGGEDKSVLIMDIGGDDVGATAIARFSPIVKRFPYTFLYVVNKYRNLTQQATDAVAVLHEIEGASHLQATGIINNSHLRDDTTAETVSDAYDFGVECAALSGLPLVATTVPAVFTDVFEAPATRMSSLLAPNTTSEQLAQKNEQKNYYIVKKLVLTPWE